MTEATNRLLKAATGQGTGRPPIWIMRQAGRYLPQYQAIRRDHSFAEMCKRPDLATEISLQPIREFGFDAVIVFYDILFIAEAMGAPLEYTDRGPVFHKSIRSRDDVRSLKTLGPGEGSAPLLETLRNLRAELPAETALLGFAGAPFTMASYLVEGDFKRSGDRVRRMIYSDPVALEELLQHLTDATILYLQEQIEAGAQAVQLFVTWAGLLSRADYERFAQPFQRQIFEAVAKTGAPSILYLNGSNHVLELMATSGAKALSVDWRVPLPEVRQRVGSEIVLQGNLDPSTLFGPADDVKTRCQAILESMAGDPSYIFNLGHGVLPETPVESVRAVVETVKAFDPSV
ncbi:MAG: uroporphyrinogen decarboxylase [Planctomycetota bacterium]